MQTNVSCVENMMSELCIDFDKEKSVKFSVSMPKHEPIDTCKIINSKDADKLKGIGKLRLTEMIDLDNLALLKDKYANRIEKKYVKLLKRIEDNLVRGCWLETTYSSKNISSSFVLEDGVGLQTLSPAIRAYLASKNYHQISIPDVSKTIVVQLFRMFKVPGRHIEAIEAFHEIKDKVYESMISMTGDDEFADVKEANDYIFALLMDFSENSVSMIERIQDHLKESIDFDIEKLHNAYEAGAKVLVSSDTWKADCDESTKPHASDPNILGLKFSVIIAIVIKQIILVIKDSLASCGRFMDVPVGTTCLVRKENASEKTLSKEIMTQLIRDVKTNTGFSVQLECSTLPLTLGEEAPSTEDSGKISVGGLAKKIDPKSPDYFIITNNCFVHGDSMIRIAPRILSYLQQHSLLSLGTAFEIDLIHARKPGDNLWFEHENVYQFLITTLADKIVMETYSKQENIRHNILSNLSDVVKIANAVKVLAVGASRNSRSSFDRITDSTRGRVFYKNGYFDLENQRFVSKEEDPVASTYVRIEEEFDQELFDSFNDNHPIIKQLKEKICFVVGGEEDQTYVFRKLARAIGGHFDKVWNICLGPRNAGKGMLERLCKLAFGSYVTTRSPPMINTSSQDAAVKHKEILNANLHISRLAFSNEISTGKDNLLDGNAMKAQASGGDAVVCRQLFKNERAVRVTAINFFNMNEIPQIGGNTDCLETMQLINFPYKFEEAGKFASGLPTIKVADDSIKTWIHTDPSIAFAFAWLVFKHWRPTPVLHSDVPVSSRVMREAHTNVSDAKDNYSIFGRFFEIANDESSKIPYDLVLFIYKEIKEGNPLNIPKIDKANKDWNHVKTIGITKKDKFSPIAKDLKAFLDSQGIFKIHKTKGTGINRSHDIQCVLNIRFRKFTEDELEEDKDDQADDDTIDP